MNLRDFADTRQQASTGLALVLAFTLGGCSTADGAATPGSGGSNVVGASGGSAMSTPGGAGTGGGAGSTQVAMAGGGASSAGTAGATSTSAGTAGVSSSGGSAGQSQGGAAPGGASGASPGGTGGAAPGGAVDAWYEAEAAENEIDNGTERGTCATTCETVTDKASCCSGGGELRQLLGRGGTNNAGGGVTFKNVTVPSAGMYDVTWWYHCGLYDNWHDHDCGGAPYPAWLSFYDAKANPQPGCRPHLIAVNGVQQDGPDHKAPFWQFPCFGGSWNIMHVATTPLYLNAGKNDIRLGAPHIADLDAVDIDAIHVVSAGKGVAPVVPEGRPIAGDGRK